MPVGLVIGSCVYHVAYQRHRPVVQERGQQCGDGELYPGPLYARELAMARMQAEAMSLRALRRGGRAGA